MMTTLAIPTLKCSECIYEKMRFTGTVKNFWDALATNTATDCSTSRAGTLTLNYYLRPIGTACIANPCANTINDYSTYYDSFYDIMKDVIF